MTRNEQLEFCSVCTNRSFDPKLGIVCGLTNEIATFQDTCPDFNRDNIKEHTAPIADEKEVVNLDAISDDEITNKVRLQQNFPYALVGGLLAAIVGAVLWAIITVATQYQIGYMAIGIGVLVGFTVRYFGMGLDIKFGILGGSLALFGSLLGNYFSQIGFYSVELNTSFINTLNVIKLSQIPQILKESFSFMDLIFYGIAINVGFRFSYRVVTTDDMNAIATSDQSIEKSLLVKKILIGVVLAVLCGLYLFLKYGKSEEVSFVHDTGELMSRGKFSNGVKEGKWTSFYKNGHVESMGNYKNDLPDGKWQWFDESGLVSAIGTYKDGVESGGWESYFTNGVLADSGGYSQGKMNGLWVWRYDNNQIREIGNYIDDFREGKWKYFHDNGVLSSTGTLTKDEMVGTWSYFYDDGSKWKELEQDKELYYKNMWSRDGKQLVTNGQGVFEERTREGKLEMQGSIKDGKKSGIWKLYYSNEKLKVEGTYDKDVFIISNFWDRNNVQLVTNGKGKYTIYYDGSDNVFETGGILNGKRSGLWKEYYDMKGIVMSNMQYSDGSLNGPFTSFFQNGQASAEGAYIMDKKTGEWKSYVSNGQMVSKCNYKNDKIEGVLTRWNETGTKIKEETYANGKLIKEEEF